MQSCKKSHLPDPAVNSSKVTPRLVAVNEKGHRIGEDHPAAKLTDHDVELMRKMHEEYPEGHPLHWGYRRLAGKFGCTKTLARKICSYLVRNQHAASFKRGT